MEITKFVLFAITGILGSVCTFYLSIKCKKGAVFGSAVPSLLVGLVYFFLQDSLPQSWSSIPAVFMGSTFVGMASPKVLESPLWVGLSGGLFGLIFISVTNAFVGYGGKLGTIADIAVVTMFGLLVAFKKENVS